MARRTAGVDDDELWFAATGAAGAVGAVERQPGAVRRPGEMRRETLDGERHAWSECARGQVDDPDVVVAAGLPHQRQPATVGRELAEEGVGGDDRGSLPSGCHHDDRAERHGLDREQVAGRRPPQLQHFTDGGDLFGRPAAVASVPFPWPGSTVKTSCGAENPLMNASRRPFDDLAGAGVAKPTSTTRRHSTAGTVLDSRARHRCAIGPLRERSVQCRTR